MAHQELKLLYWDLVLGYHGKGATVVVEDKIVPTQKISNLLQLLPTIGCHQSYKMHLVVLWSKQHIVGEYSVVVEQHWRIVPLLTDGEAGRRWQCCIGPFKDGGLQSLVHLGSKILSHKPSTRSQHTAQGSYFFAQHHQKNYASLCMDWTWWRKLLYLSNFGTQAGADLKAAKKR